MKNLIDVITKPTVINNVHESSYKTWDILEQVLIMVEREDSKETIFEVVQLLKETKFNAEEL